MMYEEFAEVAVHAALLVFYSALTVVLAAASALVEYRSYAVVSSGDVLLAGWMAVIGLVVLVFAYFVLRDKAMVEYRHLTG
jgi:hypothetical protein